MAFLTFTHLHTQTLQWFQFPVIYPHSWNTHSGFYFPGPNLTDTNRWEKQERTGQFMEPGYGASGDEDGIQSWSETVGLKRWRNLSLLILEEKETRMNTNKSKWKEEQDILRVFSLSKAAIIKPPAFTDPLIHFKHRSKDFKCISSFNVRMMWYV